MKKQCCTMVIEINGMGPDKIFHALADAFGVQFLVNHAEYTITVPAKYGNGKITGIHYPNGTGFIHTAVTLKQEIKLIYSNHKVHPLRFIYSLEGKITHRFNDETEEHAIEQYHSAITASKFPNGNTFTLPKDQKLALTFLEINRKLFTDQLPEKAHDMKSVFYKLFFDVHATRTFFHKGLYSLKLAQLIKEINGFDRNDFLRTNFIGAKALEMLSFILMQYEDDLRDANYSRVLRQSEISAVQETADFINDNLTELPNVGEIALRVNLTSAKLQEGFKLLYKCTVNEYIMEKRLETAFMLLSKTDSQIGSVVLDIGLSSRSHFSKMFKERFRVSPIEVKMGRGKQQTI